MKGYYQLVRHTGNHDLFRALEMSVAAMANGHPFHLHAEGLRGTGKTTILRAASKILPPITRIKGCVYNCRPEQPHCPNHRNMSPEELSALGTETVPCPFLEISHSAKIGTAVGSIDLGKLIDKANPMAALLPGTILQAHRGIIFIDEINRLADTSPELADVLLDVMGTKPGRVQVEETGLPTVELPAEVTVWAASNPDEEPGSLTQVRKQLADRFDLVVNMGRPSEYQSVLAILARQDDRANNARLVNGLSESFHQVTVNDELRKVLATVYIDYGLESLRAVEALETAARLSAVQAARQAVSVQDISSVAPLVLGHRTDNTTLTSILKYLDSLNFGQEQSLATPAADIAAPEINPAAKPKQKRKRPSLLADFWRNMRQRFGSKSAEAERRTDGSKQQESRSQNRSQGSSAGGQTDKIADPTTVPINAPPKAAVPLKELPIEQFVTGEDKRPHV